MLQDPEMYPSPKIFDPSRFLSSSTESTSLNPDPRTYVFGFGRRICVGNLFADNVLFISIASILACFDIKKKVVDGKEVVPEVKYLKHIGRPEPFVCDITLRSETAGALISAVAVAQPEVD